MIFFGGELQTACQMRLRYKGAVFGAYECLAGKNGERPLTALQGLMDGFATLYYPPPGGSKNQYHEKYITTI